jgi:heat-inducible transcriptional repressor
MAEGLTARQIQILKSLIDEYIETAEPVGSGALDKKYNLGISPATIRNEMVTLTKFGFLKQPHTSSGRVPTPKAR